MSECFGVGVSVFWHEMPPALPPVATGGLAAAVVSSILSNPVPPPLFCQDLNPDRICWTTFLVGVLCGLVVAQLLEFCVLVRQYIRLQLRLQGGAVGNYLAIKSRVG